MIAMHVVLLRPLANNKATKCVKYKHTLVVSRYNLAPHKEGYRADVNTSACTDL